MDSGNMDSAKAQEQVKSILGPTKDAEFMQSFVRVGTRDEEEENSTTKPSISKRITNDSKNEEDKPIKTNKGAKPKRKFLKHKRERRRREEEVYTDKDRAAAVVMGHKDIKQSLSLKNKAERSSALHLPAETDAGTLLGLARAELAKERYDIALSCVDKAIELSPEDKVAFVARSKCYLLLGEPQLALADAETALNFDPKYVQALLHKAEALYYCGEFEMSLVHYHRGLRTRPDLQAFRLGVQKAQEAIENTIGASKSICKPKTRKSKKSSRSVLDQLMTDKLYLEKLLKNPDLTIAHKRNEDVAKQAEEALKFLENRAEFWRQQETSKR